VLRQGGVSLVDCLLMNSVDEWRVLRSSHTNQASRCKLSTIEMSRLLRFKTVRSVMRKGANRCTCERAECGSEWSKRVDLQLLTGTFFQRTQDIGSIR
jgi:hypothetical protein